MKRAKQINQLNDKELSLGYTNTSSSWHFQEKYNSSSYIYIGGLDYRLTEGDILTVFSQYGEIIDIDLIREEEDYKDYNKDYKDYNKNNNKMSKGFCFLSYENIKSTILAIDNLNGIQLGDKIICVDHAPNYYKKVKNLEENDKEEEMIVYKVVNGERKIDHDEMKKRNVNWIHEYLMKELYY